MKSSPHPRLVIVEANRGRARQAALLEHASSLETSDKTWLLDCDVDRAGIWAGLREWLLELSPDLRAAGLLAKHSFAISRIVPELRSELAVRGLSLTDVSSPQETVRNYALDRAYRICQGVVDLIDEWFEGSGQQELTVLCDSFNRSGALVRRFFRELVRRRGCRMRLTLVIGVDIDCGQAMSSELACPAAEHFRVDVASDPEVAEDAASFRERAMGLEAEILDDETIIEMKLPELIRYWLQSDQPKGALRWQAFALGMYNHYGFYEDALRFVEPARLNLEELSTRGGWYTRWNLVGSMFGCLIALGKSREGLELVREEAMAKIKDAADLARACYVMAMLHARYLPEKDFELAESYLERGLAHLKAATWETDLDRHFFTVFLWNGLAFVRHRQGRPEEAVALCRKGSAHLDANLAPDQHRLHRSVLLYNEAQVFASLGKFAEALRAFTVAMEMDPNYSEYYNERGSVYLGLGDFDAALQDFQHAILTSPPYPEVWTNLGQCFRAMGRMSEAERSFAKSLDYEPSGLLARLARAQCLDALGRLEEARKEYDLALAIDPNQPDALSNRAVLRYQLGDLEGSSHDLDSAIEKAPKMPTLFQNRAVVLRELGFSARAAADLRTFLELAGDTPDAEEARATLNRWASEVSGLDAHAV